MAVPAPVSAPPPEPSPQLAAEELQGRLDIFAGIFQTCNSDVAKQASLNERKIPPPAEGEDAEPEDEEKRKEREIQEKRNQSLTYGEMPMDVLHKLLNTVKNGEVGALYDGKGTFLDLGSGAGKACIAAGLLHQFEKVVGIETLDCLNNFANTAAEQYKAVETVADNFVKPEVQFIKEDFVANFEAALEPLASTVVVCLAVANAYHPEQLKAMADLALKMPDKSFFITTGQALPDSCTFALNRHPLQRRAVNVKRCLAKRGTDPDKVIIEEPEVHEEVGWVEIPCSPLEIEMAWGPSKCFIYYKKPGPFSEGWEKGEGPWPQLVGLQKDEAKTKLQEARADLQVELVEATAMVTTDFVAERVRIRFDPATDLVVEPPPQCG
jgi:hypothetical protein